VLNVTLIKDVLVMIDWEYKCLIYAHGALGAGNISFWHRVYSWRNMTLSLWAVELAE